MSPYHFVPSISAFFFSREYGQPLLASCCSTPIIPTFPYITLPLTDSTFFGSKYTHPINSSQPSATSTPQQSQPSQQAQPPRLSVFSFAHLWIYCISSISSVGSALPYVPFELRIIDSRGRAKDNTMSEKIGQPVLRVSCTAKALSPSPLLLSINETINQGCFMDDGKAQNRIEHPQG